jgi:hypothetical protein
MLLMFWGDQISKLGILRETKDRPTLVVVHQTRSDPDLGAEQID